MPFWRTKRDAGLPHDAEVDLANLSLAELAVNIFQPRLLDAAQASLDKQLALLSGDPGREKAALLRMMAATELGIRVTKTGTWERFSAGEVESYRSFLRAGMADGQYGVELTQMDAASENAHLQHHVCVVFLGLSVADAHELVTKVKHVGPQPVREGVSLQDAVHIKETLEPFGISAKVREDAGVDLHDEPSRAAIRVEVRREVWRRDGGRCVDCGSRERLEYDHIIPLSKGGGNTVRNIELRCESCNRTKAASI